MNAALDIAPEVGLKPACDALGVSRATLYRRRRPKVVRPTRTSWRALSAEERAWLGALAPQIEAAIAADANALGSGDAWQALIFSAAKEAGLQPVRAFAALSAAFLGRTNGPRAGWLLAAIDRTLILTRLRAAADVQGVSA